MKTFYTIVKGKLFFSQMMPGGYRLGFPPANLENHRGHSRKHDFSVAMVEEKRACQKNGIS